MFCPQCNTPIAEGTRFCPNCGMACNNESVAQPVNPQPEPQPEVQPEVQPEFQSQFQPEPQPEAQYDFTPEYQEQPQQAYQYAQNNYQQPQQTPYYSQQAPYYSQQPSHYTHHVYEHRDTITEDDLPEKFRPMGAWAYFGLKLLFAIPIIGFIFLIVFSFNDGNRNRRSFARSYWCDLLIASIIMLIFVLIIVAAYGSLDRFF